MNGRLYFKLSKIDDLIAEKDKKITALEAVVQEQQELLNEASESLCGECNEIARIYVSDKICDYLEESK